MYTITSRLCMTLQSKLEMARKVLNRTHSVESVQIKSEMHSSCRLFISMKLGKQIRASGYL